VSHFALILLIVELILLVFCLPAIIALYISYVAAVRNARRLRRARQHGTRISTSPLPEWMRGRLRPLDTTLNEPSVDLHAERIS
jgi:hypothetical protein